MKYFYYPVPWHLEYHHILDRVASIHPEVNRDQIIAILLDMKKVLAIYNIFQNENLMTGKKILHFIQPQKLYSWKNQNNPFRVSKTVKNYRIIALLFRKLKHLTYFWYYFYRWPSKKKKSITNCTISFAWWIPNPQKVKLLLHYIYWWFYSVSTKPEKYYKMCVASHLLPHQKQKVKYCSRHIWWKTSSTHGKN